MTHDKCFSVFLASWAEDLPWKRVAERFRTPWQSVYRSVEKVVKYGLKHRDLSGVLSIDVDEIKYRKQIKDKFLTVVYQLDKGSRRLLWVGQSRTSYCFRKFFVEMEEKFPEFKSGVKFACSDMWRAYLKVIRKEISNGITEGLNNNAKVAFRKARGYRSFNVAQIALYHQMGKLPKPKFKHEVF